jgi:hypothetical protein
MVYYGILWYNTQNQWVLGLCPSFGVLNNQKTQRFGNWACFRCSGEGIEMPSLGSFGKGSPVN